MASDSQRLLNEVAAARGVPARRKAQSHLRQAAPRQAGRSRSQAASHDATGLCARAGARPDCDAANALGCPAPPPPAEANESPAWPSAAPAPFQLSSSRSTSRFRGKSDGGGGAVLSVIKIVMGGLGGLSIAVLGVWIFFPLRSIRTLRATGANGGQQYHARCKRHADNAQAQAAAQACRQAGETRPCHD